MESENLNTESPPHKAEKPTKTGKPETVSPNENTPPQPLKSPAPISADETEVNSPVCYAHQEIFRAGFD